MKRQVLEYFEDLKSMKLPRHKNAIIFNDASDCQKITSNVHKANLNDTPYYFKGWNDVNSLFEIASSKMYGDVGILTPPIQVGRFPKNHTDDNSHYFTISQDVNSLENLDIVLAKDIPEFKKIKNKYSSCNFKWQLLYDRALREEFLKFMTEDCLDELINVYLGDELRTDFDRHFANFFLYKSPNSERYEGIIPIDLEAGLICCHADNAWGGFDTYIHPSLFSSLPTGGIDDTNHITRISNIRELLDAGVLSQHNITLLKDVVGYDFHKTIQNTANKYNLKDKAYKVFLPDIIEKLWEYNYQHLGKDLGI